MSRRASSRFNRGRISNPVGAFAAPPAPPPGGPTQLWTFVTSANCLAAWQSDFGITAGATPLAFGASPPVVTTTGSISGIAANGAYRLEIQTTGSDGVATYRYGNNNDGTTATFIESGKVVPGGGGSYAAIGDLAGLTFVFPAGSYTNDNVYQAVAASWTDQKAGLVAAQATQAKQPLILLNAGGRVALRGDGVNDSMLEPTLDRPAPATTPTFIWFVMRVVTAVNNKCLLDSGPGTEGLTIYLPTAIGVHFQMSNGGTSNDNTGANPAGTLVTGYAYFTASASDALKLGSAAESTGVSAGPNNPSPGVRMFAFFNDTAFGNFDLCAAFYYDARPTVGELNALKAGAQAMYSGITT